MRLDVCIFSRGLALSRTEAKTLITDGNVFVNGKIIKKPSYEVLDEDCVKLERTSKSFASRGGLKLDAALSHFGIDPQGKLAIDIGASSGGFTDCLLAFGARHVIAVDSGRGQMVERLRADKRVTVIEGYNARFMQPSDLEYTPTLAVMDVSFISATYIIEPLAGVLPPKAEFICLIKPQFEVGKQNIGKGGIVKDKSAREKAIKKVTEFANSVGFTLVGITESPIKGGDGNVEFLAYFIKE